ncbi:MAG TPA: hypothetical protein VKC61_22875 [Pyrinomonadaceae bacterium]|nr:hypothetical protein [Pyrinomonadaceae bacterium]
MRDEEIDLLRQPYTTSRGDLDRRFYSSIGADVPHANELLEEIFSDLDENTFGVSWWMSLPTEERILISDYLYQCVDGIEKNLGEAKLHYFDWLEARDRQNERIGDVISRNPYGELEQKMPASHAAIDDLPNRLEALHLCGFFRAIGSSLDCLGAAIIGVLGLPTSLRRSDIIAAEKALAKITTPKNPSEQLQFDFTTFLETVKKDAGPEDWFEWTMQYRNMFVHRGRRIVYNQLKPREVLLFDHMEQVIPRSTSSLHMATHPDKSDAEALIRNKIVLNEDADVTFNGIFRSCRDMLEAVSERLVSTWQERRANPTMVEQPIAQWNSLFKPCKFTGYTPNAEPLGADAMIGHPVLRHRMLSASVDDAHRNLWANAKWNQ